MPDFAWKVLNGTEVFACRNCPEQDGQGVPNHRNIRGKFECLEHDWHHVVDPQPDGVPRRLPCPGDVDNPGAPKVYAQELMCTHCQDGVWHPAPPAE